MAIRTMVDVASGRIEWTSDEPGAAPVVFAIHGIEANREQTERWLAMHGAKQKVGDAGAIPRDTETGKSATDAEKLDAMRKVADALHQGETTTRAPAGEGESGLLVEVLARASGRNRAELAKECKGLDAKTRDAILADPGLVAIAAEVRAERAKAKVVPVTVAEGARAFMARLGVKATEGDATDD